MEYMAVENSWTQHSCFKVCIWGIADGPGALWVPACYGAWTMVAQCHTLPIIFITNCTLIDTTHRCVLMVCIKPWLCSLALAMRVDYCMLQVNFWGFLEILWYYTTKKQLQIHFSRGKLLLHLLFTFINPVLSELPTQLSVLSCPHTQTHTHT